MPKNTIKLIYNKILAALLIVVVLMPYSLMPVYARYHKQYHKQPATHKKSSKNNKQAIKAPKATPLKIQVKAHALSPLERALQAKAIRPKLVIPNNPTDLEIFNLRVFSEPIIAMVSAKSSGAKSSNDKSNGENQALAMALNLS